MPEEKGGEAGLEWMVARARQEADEAARAARLEIATKRPQTVKKFAVADMASEQAMQEAAARQEIATIGSAVERPTGPDVLSQLGASFKDAMRRAEGVFSIGNPLVNSLRRDLEDLLDRSNIQRGEPLHRKINETYQIFGDMKKKIKAAGVIFNDALRGASKPLSSELIFRSLRSGRDAAVEVQKIGDDLKIKIDKLEREIQQWADDAIRVARKQTQTGGPVRAGLVGGAALRYIESAKRHCNSLNGDVYYQIKKLTEFAARSAQLFGASQKK